MNTNDWRERGYMIAPKSIEDLDLDWEGKRDAERNNAYTVTIEVEEANMLISSLIHSEIEKIIGEVEGKKSGITEMEFRTTITHADAKLASIQARSMQLGYQHACSDILTTLRTRLESK